MLKLVFAWAVLWTCCTFSATRSELCEGITDPCVPGKFYPDADDCTMYYECDAGIVFNHHACDDSTPFFNIDSEKCEVQGSHDCSYRCVTPSPTVPTGSTTSTTPTPSPTIQTGSTITPDPPSTAPAGSSTTSSSSASATTPTASPSTPSGSPTSSSVAGSTTVPIASPTVTASPASSPTPATASTATAPTTTATTKTPTAQQPVQTQSPPNGAGRTGASFVALTAAVTLACWTPVAGRA